MNDGNGGYDRLLEKRLDAIEGDIKDLDVKVQGLQTWRSWVAGMAVAVGLMFGAFGKGVVDFLRHL